MQWLHIGVGFQVRLVRKRPVFAAQPQFLDRFFGFSGMGVDVCQIVGALPRQVLG